jgi:hypothetical protein
MRGGGRIGVDKTRGTLGGVEKKAGYGYRCIIMVCIPIYVCCVGCGRVYGGVDTCKCIICVWGLSPIGAFLASPTPRVGEWVSRFFNRVCHRLFMVQAPTYKRVVGCL